jgi:hypothetical protein
LGYGPINTSIRIKEIVAQCIPPPPPFRHRRVPITTMSTSRLPHCEQTSRRRHLGTGVSGPYQRACSAGSGSLR